MPGAPRRLPVDMPCPEAWRIMHAPWHGEQERAMGEGGEMGGGGHGRPCHPPVPLLPVPAPPAMYAPTSMSFCLPHFITLRRSSM